VIITEKRWITLENQQSVKAKMQFIDDNFLAGVSVRNLEDDDYEGLCENHFPLTGATVTEIL